MVEHFHQNPRKRGKSHQHQHQHHQHQHQHQPKGISAGGEVAQSFTGHNNSVLHSIGHRVQSTALARDIHFKVLEHKTNDWVRSRINFSVGPEGLPLTTVRRRKLAWFGHVTRHDSLSKAILLGTSEDNLLGNSGHPSGHLEEIVIFRSWSTSPTTGCGV